MRATNVNQLLANRYSELYRSGLKHDSPEVSRTQMGKAVLEYLFAVQNEHPTILDIGSGPQMLERQLFARGADPRMKHVRNRLAQTIFFTLDIAETVKLYAPDHCVHLRGDSRALPFSNSSLDLVLSNHSIDMLRAVKGDFYAALHEVARALKPGGVAFFNYHPTVLYEDNISRARTWPNLSEFYYAEDDSNPFYADGHAIYTDLEMVGLQPVSIEYVDEAPEFWWSVRAVKPIS